MKKLKIAVICMVTLINSACGQSVIEVTNKNFMTQAKDENFYSPGTWATKVNSNEPVKDGAFVQVNQKLFSIGGDKGNNWLAINNVFDIENNKWELKAPMSTNRSGLGAGVIDNKIYVIGGFNGNKNEWLSNLEVYDPATDTWLNKTSMGNKRSSVGTAVIDKNLYVVGGSLAEEEWTNKLEEYDSQMDTWKSLEPMETARAQIAVAAVSNKIYVIGGENEKGILAKVEEYNLKTNKWRTKADMPTPRANAEIIAYKSSLIVMGGRDSQGKSLNSVDIYNTDTNRWSVGNPISSAMEGFGVSINSDGTSIYIHGGLTTQGTSDKLEMSSIEKKG